MNTYAGPNLKFLSCVSKSEFTIGWVDEKYYMIFELWWGIHEKYPSLQPLQDGESNFH